MKKKLLIAFTLMMVFPIYFSVRLLVTFPFTPESLIVEHHPKKVDLIVIPSGEMERVEHALYLAEQGYADTLLYTGGYLDRYKSEYISRNMVEGVSFIVKVDSVSTYTDAKITAEFLRNRGDIEKIMLVTSPYHSYRVYRTFSKVIPDKKLISAPVKNSFFSVEDARNRKDSFSRKSFRSEQFKYLFYAVRYGI